MSVSIQAVSAAIRSTEGIQVSRRYAGNKRAIGGQATRSNGVYTELDSRGNIIIGYRANNGFGKDKAQASLEAVIATLNAKGMTATLNTTHHLKNIFTITK